MPNGIYFHTSGRKRNKESGDFCADLVEFQNEMTHEKAVFAHW